PEHGGGAVTGARGAKAGNRRVPTRGIWSDAGLHSWTVDSRQGSRPLPLARPQRRGWPYAIVKPRLIRQTEGATDALGGRFASLPGANWCTEKRQHYLLFPLPCVRCGVCCCGAVAPRVTAALLGRFLPRLGPLAPASGPFFLGDAPNQVPGRERGLI